MTGFQQPSGSTYGPWLTAVFDGECDDCGIDIWAGDQIRGDGEGGWLCGDCGYGQ